MGGMDRVLSGQGLFNKLLPVTIREWWQLYRMRSYWNSCAQENARKHIAIDDWERENNYH